MTPGQGFLIVLGIALQTIFASAMGSPSLFMLYLIVIALLWGLVVSIVRGKNRSLTSWIWACFWLGPLIALVATLFFGKVVDEPKAIPGE